jgi:hypothetical protein
MTRHSKNTKFIKGVAVMKPIWTHTLAWLAAVVVALLLALAGPDGFDRWAPDPMSHGAAAPR